MKVPIPSGLPWEPNREGEGLKALLLPGGEYLSRSRVWSESQYGRGVAEHGSVAPLLKEI